MSNIFILFKINQFLVMIKISIILVLMVPIMTIIRLLPMIDAMPTVANPSFGGLLVDYLVNLI